MRLELPAEPETVAKVRHELDALASRFDCDVDAVGSAVSEIVGNAVNHAYVGREPGLVVVLARLMRGRLVITVADRGRGMVPRVDSPGRGIGLPVVSKLANDVRIESDDTGAAVSMSFECKSTAAERARSVPGTGADLRGELERAREVLRRGRP